MQVFKRYFNFFFLSHFGVFFDKAIQVLPLENIPKAQNGYNSHQTASLAHPQIVRSFLPSILPIVSHFVSKKCWRAIKQYIKNLKNWQHIFKRTNFYGHLITSNCQKINIVDLDMVRDTSHGLKIILTKVCLNTNYKECIHLHILTSFKIPHENQILGESMYRCPIFVSRTLLNVVYIGNVYLNYICVKNITKSDL